MTNNNFFNKKVEFLTLKQVLKITKSNVKDDNVDLDQKIYGVATLHNAGSNEISFLNSGKYASKLIESNAGFCLVEEKYLSKKPDNMVGLINENPYYAYAVLLNSFYEENIKLGYISDEATIENSAKIGKNCTIMAGAYIGHNVNIGDNSTIGVNSVINDNVEIGSNAIVNNLVNISNSKIGNNFIAQAGAKIGQDGFGFAHNKGVNYKILQLGIVEIGSDVEVGANTCIDRGSIENTIIGNQVKLDNMVQIAHNVTIGDGTVIAGAACVAGSTKVGKYCQIGGNSSISGHIEVGDFAMVAGASGVARSVGAKEAVGGLPAVPIKDWHRMTLKLLKLIRS